MLTRSGFRRPVYERVPTVHRPIPPELRRNASMAPVVVTDFIACPKEDLIQHQGYMDIVRTMRCAHCGRPGPSQFCHRDEGKGMGIKSDCREGWPGCPECHYAIGTLRIYPKEDRRLIEAAMGKATRDEIEARGLWPKSLARYIE